MSPSGGSITTVEPCITWSPVKSMPVAAELVAHVVGRVAGRVQRRSVTSPRASASPCAGCRTGANVRVLARRRGGRQADHLGPVAAASRAASGE